MSRLLALLGVLALAGSGVYLGCRSEPEAPAPRAEAPKGVVPPPEARAESPRAAAWAADEMQVLIAPGADVTKILPGAKADGELRIPPAADRAEWIARAKEVEARPGVKEIRPVFYATGAALEKRLPSDRLILTRRLAATLPEGLAPETLAARYGARVVEKLEYKERTWLFEAAGPFAALDLEAALRDREGLAYAAAQFARPVAKRTRRLIPDDTLFGDQWHLRNTGQGGGTAGEDIRVTTAWDTVLGTGVAIGIVDDGLERTHEDLVDNYSAALSLDINDGDADPTPISADDHGTACAGLAAARGNNAQGVSGAAPRATLAGLRLTAAAVSDAQEAQAMDHLNASIHVKSNSWGPADNVIDLREPGPLFVAALSNGVTAGRGGLGTVYVWAGGNGRGFGDNSNFDAYANQRFVIGVGALTRQGVQTVYSEPGANLLVCAPGGLSDITTTDLNDTRGVNATDYRNEFDGTSAATPIVAGVVALMLERSPTLKARDVMHVLVRTARQNHPADADWTTNAAGFSVNHKYGHGAVDATAAVDLAWRFPQAGPVVTRSASSGPLAMNVADFPDPGVFHDLQISGTPMIAEHVEIDFSGTHEFRGDWQLTLVAPSGTRSELTRARFDPDDVQGFNNRRFMSVRHWGEAAVGTWRLEVKDGAAVDVGSFTGWTLRVFGTSLDTTPPPAGAVNDGPGADVDVQSSATTVQANWPGFTDPDSGVVYEWAVGTTPGGAETAPFVEVGYATSDTRSGLAFLAGTTYYVTVRATNFAGLSSTSTSDGFTIDSLPPDAPAAPAVTPAASATGLFQLGWGAPADPGGSGVASYTIQRSLNGGGFVDLVGGHATLSFDANVAASGPGTYRFRVGAVDAAGNAGAFSPDSAAVLYDPTPPSATITGPTSSDTFATGAAPLALVVTASDAGAGVVAVSWVNAATGAGGLATPGANWTASVGLAPGANLVTIFAWDALGNVATDALTVTFTPTDILPPSITISVPTSAASFSTSATPLGLQGAAFDDTGVTAVEWANLTTGTRGPAAGTAFWTASVPLLAGSNLIVVTARDAAGHATSATLTVAFTPPAEAVLPAVAITSPNSDPFATGTSPLALSGTASDNAALALVRWSNAATGGGGTADGLGTWSASVALAPGANAVTVTAVDASGNEATDTVTVNFTPAGGDTIPPLIEIRSPAAGTAFSTSSSEVTLAGLASDDTAAVEVTWTNAATGESGTAAGVGAWSARIALLAGANAITVRVFDAAGNSRTDLLTVTFSVPVAGGGGGGGGGCGLTGFEILPLLFLRRRRRR